MNISLNSNKLLVIDAIRKRMSYSSYPIDSNFSARGVFRVRLTATMATKQMTRAREDSTKYTIVRSCGKLDGNCIILLDFL